MTKLYTHIYVTSVPKFTLQPSEEPLWKMAFMVEGQEGNLILDKETNKREMILPKNTRNGSVDKCRIYYGVMNQNLKCSVQGEDNM